jgi:hypothetical protein
LDLPVEIIQQIASLADTLSAASFSLSCQQILKVLGYSYIKHFQILSGPLRFTGNPLVLYGSGSVIDPGCFSGKPADRWKFLHLLDRDIPDKILCHVCYRFHSPSGCKYWRVDDWMNWQNHPFGSNFTFSRAQYAMKQHRLGLGWDSTHTQNFLKPPLDTRLCKGRPIISFEAKLVSDKLFLRIEDRRRLPLQKTDDMPSFTWNILCAHSYRMRERSMPHLVKCRLSRYFNGNGGAECSFCGNLMLCPCCPTEFQITIQDGDIVLTVWKYFGDVKSPFDPMWSLHFGENNRGVGVPAYGPGKIKSIFEAGTF